jgi:MSHA pilin protein MshC
MPKSISGSISGPISGSIQRPSSRYKLNKGFTLIELVITIIVVGILSAVVVPSMIAVTQHDATTAADELRRNISHVQLIAISQSQRLRLSVNAAGTNYTVLSCNNTACTSTTAVTDPATGAVFSVDLTNGVTFTFGANSTLDFDSLGRPQSNGSLIATIPARTYTISGSGHSVSVSVMPITGFAS